MFTLIALAAAPIWVPILLIAYFSYKSAKETRKMKEAEARTPNEQETWNVWNWTRSEIKAQHLRNEYDKLIHRMFPGILMWNTQEDVAINYNGLHMTRLYYGDGTIKNVPIVVHATDTFIELYDDESKDENETKTKPDVQETSPQNVQKQNNEEEQADNWIKEHKDFMFQKLISETAFSLPLTDFPDSEKVISLILDKYSLSGKFSIYQDDEEQVIRFVPVLDDVIIEK